MWTYLCRSTTYGGDQLKEIYNKDYFHGEEYSDYIAERDTIERNFKRISNIINKYITNKKYKKYFRSWFSIWFFSEHDEG